MPALTFELVAAIAERRVAFQVEMPRILATYTGGDKSGEVEIVGTDKGRVIVAKASSPKRFVVDVGSLDVDATTREHLQRNVNWLRAWKQGGYKAGLITNKA